MIGGFLGAGKTTLIARLAKHFIHQGQRVGVVTNDQAYGLVDSLSLRGQGFHVGEVAGACFCCKFDELIEAARQLADHQIPDIILAEPVGSCTDLVATVVEPLRHLHGDQYDIGPLAVLLKPEHGTKILRSDPQAGFSAKAAYIFLKQLEEADVIAINKIDTLRSEARGELAQRVTARFPQKTVVEISARDGTGFPELVDVISKPSASRATAVEVDYDTYAEGEAELGWLNGTICFRSPHGTPFPLDPLVCDYVSRVQDALCEQGVEPAHLKVLVADDYGNTAVANLTSSQVDAELSLPSAATADAAQLTVNARVATDPQALEQVVRHAADSVASSYQLHHTIDSMQRFRPGRPVPRHRMAPIDHRPDQG
jgi:G3E family GTPase